MSGRIPQGEVIVDFADGGSYIKSKLEDSVLHLERRRIEKENGRKAQSAMEALGVSKSSIKAEDVDFLVKQVGCSRPEAENALRDSDVVQALMKLVKPAKRARSVDGG